MFVQQKTYTPKTISDLYRYGFFVGQSVVHTLPL